MIDQVREDNSRFNHFQVVVHGAAFAQHVIDTLHGFGQLYNRGETYVLQVDELTSGAAPGSGPGTTGSYTVARTNGDQVQAFVQMAREGAYTSGNYIFRGCTR